MCSQEKALVVFGRLCAACGLVVRIDTVTHLTAFILLWSFEHFYCCIKEIRLFWRDFGRHDTGTNMHWSMREKNKKLSRVSLSGTFTYKRRTLLPHSFLFVFLFSLFRTRTVKSRPAELSIRQWWEGWAKTTEASSWLSLDRQTINWSISKTSICYSAAPNHSVVLLSLSPFLSLCSLHHAFFSPSLLCRKCSANIHNGSETQ